MRIPACGWTLLAAMLVASSGTVSGQDGIRKQRVNFASGKSSATITGSITGGESSDEATFVGSASGARWSGTLPAAGDYSIRVYLMRNAARRNETATYTLDVGIGSARSK